MTAKQQLSTKLDGIFYLAAAEVQDFEKLQPGEWLVHTNDVQEVLDTLRCRIDDALGLGR